MDDKNIRTRFAPSPTGNLHIGSARTALFNYLFAKQNNGKLILRIEDTDTERSKKEYEEDILANLKLLGLDWDEFYRQTERLDIYKKYLQKLLDENKAYYCFCAKEELEAERQEQASRGEAPKYNGKCANISKEEAEERAKRGEKRVIRFKIPSKKVKFNDLIRGEVEFDASLLGDIVIAKDLNTPLYNFAVVVDDFEMGITHIVRGEDHLPNTPKQILIQEAVGFNPIQYAHLPLILGPDRSKMSKRHGAAAVSEYLEQGYLPEAIINFLAFLGWNPGTDKEMFTLDGLVKEFSIEKIQKSGAVFNIQRLDYLNGVYIRQMQIDKLTELCKKYVPQINDKVVLMFRERLRKLSEIAELSSFIFEEELSYDKELLRWKGMSDEDVLYSLDKSINLLCSINEEEWGREAIEKKLLQEAGDKKGELLWPLRVALSGKKASPPPFEIAYALGKEKTLKRLKNAKDLF
ncbi:MAG: glutamate--tRNA ligase [bacterium]|nr:glutamate--tRNA ligase [bacterium]